MILKEDIKTLVGNHVSPYIYNAKEFNHGKTPIYYSGPYWDNKETEAALDSFTKRHIEKVLDAVNQDKKEAAKLLGLGLSSLYRKMDELNITRRNPEQVR